MIWYRIFQCSSKIIVRRWAILSITPCLCQHPTVFYFFLNSLRAGTCVLHILKAPNSTEINYRSVRICGFLLHFFAMISCMYCWLHLSWKLRAVFLLCEVQTKIAIFFLLHACQASVSMICVDNTNGCLKTYCHWKISQNCSVILQYRRFRCWMVCIETSFLETFMSPCRRSSAELTCCNAEVCSCRYSIRHN